MGGLFYFPIKNFLHYFEKKPQRVSVMQIIEISRRRSGPATAAQKLEVEEKIKKLKRDNDKMTTGMFEFTDAQGGWFEFSYRFLKGESIKTIKINHGEIIDIPVLLARHLNNIYKKVRMPAPERDESGRPTKQGSLTKISRVRFIPMDMINPDIIESKAM